MKKHLAALAVAGAIAAPAMAQNAAIYGTFAVTASQYSGTTSDISSVNEDWFSTSVLGIKVSEDLGQGMKAYVGLEGNLETTTSTGFGFDRQSHVGLSGDFGDVRVGRASTALDSLRGFGGNGGNINDVQTISVGGKKTGTTRYQAPKMAGLDLVISHVNSNDGDGTAVTNTNPTSTEFSVAGKVAMVNFAVGYGEGKTSTFTSQADTTVVNLSAPVGPATVLFQAIRNTEGTTEKNWNSFGVTYPLGAGLTADLNYKTYDTTGSTSDYKRTGLALGKALSKRTSIHAAYASVSYDAAASESSDFDMVAVGVTHQF